MTILDDFIAAADQLVQFQYSYKELPIAEKSITYLETSKEELKILWSKIKSCYSACVVDETKDDIESIKAKYRTSSTIYITVLSEIIDTYNKLKLIKEDESKVSFNENSKNSSPCIKVPPCDTEIFYGDYLTWPSFRDMFTAVYINHPKLCAVQKLFHLRSKTKGEAYNIVSKFPLTVDNFELAWKALSEQYENRRILVNNQIKNLFNLPVIAVESGKDIRDLQRNINDCLSILKAHKLSIESWDPILVYLCSNRLPESTLSLWEQLIKSPRDIPNWNEMDIFLTNRYRALETVSDLKFSSKPKGQTTKTQVSQPTQKQKHKAFHTKIYNFSCKLCQGSHPIRLCPKFLEMNVSERISKVNALKFCQNCLSPSHELKTCQSNYHCTVCKKRHHSLLHNSCVQTQSVLSTSTPEFKPQQIQSTAPISSHQVNTCFAQNNQRIILATALINILHLGNTYTLRALIDSGSEVTLLSEDTQRKLRLPVKPIQAQIAGMSAVVTAHSSKLCNLCIGSKYNPSFTLCANAIVLKKLTGDLPSCFILPEEVANPLDFDLADPYFYESSKIDIVIGSDLYPSIIQEGIKRDIFGSLIAQHTIFGWVLSGPLRQESFKCNTTTLTYISETPINQQMSKFWEVEEIPELPIPSLEDEICERLYSETTTRNAEGRYIVRLPFKNPILKLGYSREIALKQFTRMENSLKKNPQFHAQYNEVLEEYATLGHMKSVPSEELIKNNQICSYYLPHHSVIKSDSTTTKIRVVFNASRASNNGTSLNDMLYTGPSLQTDLMTLILKWRFYQFVFNADIEKMYRQILVHPDDTTFQRILFRKSADSNVEDCELQTVTFGVNCAPYLAIRTLLQLADDVQHTLPLASAILRKEFYVDDVLSGAHDITTAIEAQRQLSEALSSAGFSLRKWTSNCLDLINHIPASDRYDQDFLKLEDRSISKTLGIKWNASSDSFHFSFQALKEDYLLTKRAVLSVIARLFDPAGWLAPIIITAKIIMQQIWRDGTSWDTPLVPLTCHRWKTFFANLPDIRDIQVPRWINYEPTLPIQIHGFSDASEQAYAAVFYIRVQHSKDSWSCHLLCCKSKVAPVKQLALPRLELCGAVLLSNLYKKIITQLACSQHELFLWTDSSIVLSWLNKPPCTWKTFVGNRVSQIQTNVPNAKWNHVRSASNPADLPTRGLSPKELKSNSLWWHGPSWLCQSSYEWPKSALNEIQEINLELRPIKSNLASLKPNIDSVLDRFSSLPKSLRVVCYIMRFFQGTHRPLRESFS